MWLAWGVGVVGMECRCGGHGLLVWWAWGVGVVGMGCWCGGHGV